MPQPKTLRARFEEKVNRDGPIPEQWPELGPCWTWLAGHFKQTGYALLCTKRDDGKWRPGTAHRIAWELYVGPIPPGLQVDHLCRNRGCVNPRHLEPVTQKVNLARGDSQSAIAVRTNRCHRDHEFTPENTRIKRNGKRDCRACARIRESKRVRIYRRRLTSK